MFPMMAVCSVAEKQFISPVLSPPCLITEISVSAGYFLCIIGFNQHVTPTTSITFQTSFYSGTVPLIICPTACTQATMDPKCSHLICDALWLYIHDHSIDCPFPRTSLFTFLIRILPVILDSLPVHSKLSLKTMFAPPCGLVAL